MTEAAPELEAAPPRTYDVFWIHVSGGRAVVGCPSDTSIGSLLPDHRLFLGGFLMAEGLGEEETRAMVRDGKP
jgi:hypothetical protein